MSTVYIGNKDPQSYVNGPYVLAPDYRDNKDRRGRVHEGECEDLVRDFAPWLGNQRDWHQGTALLQMQNGRVVAAPSIPENSPIGTFNESGKYGGLNGGQEDAKILRYFIRNDGQGHHVRWNPETDRPDQIIGARVVQQIPEGYNGFTGHRPQETDILIGQKYPFNIQDFSTIQGREAPPAGKGPQSISVPARTEPQPQAPLTDDLRAQARSAAAASGLGTDLPSRQSATQPIGGDFGRISGVSNSGGGSVSTLPAPTPAQPRRSAPAVQPSTPSSPAAAPAADRSVEQWYANHPISAHEILKPGMKGDAVYDLQMRLTAMNLLKSGDAFDTYNEPMKEAVRRFQSEHKLKIDGVAGPQTIRSLNATMAVMANPPAHVQVAMNEMDARYRTPLPGVGGSSTGAGKYGPIFDSNVSVRVSSAFGPRPNQHGGKGIEMMDGYDYAVGKGSHIRAIADGTVESVYNETGGLQGGMTVIVRLADGNRMVACHVDPNVPVHPGQPVRQGDPIATVGDTGLIHGIHSYVKVTDSSRRPIDYLHMMPESYQQAMLDQKTREARNPIVQAALAGHDTARLVTATRQTNGEEVRPLASPRGQQRAEINTPDRIS